MKAWNLRWPKFPVLQYLRMLYTASYCFRYCWHTFVIPVLSIITSLIIISSGCGTSRIIFLSPGIKKIWEKLERRAGWVYDPRVASGCGRLDSPAARSSRPVRQKNTMRNLPMREKPWHLPWTSIYWENANHCIMKFSRVHNKILGIQQHKIDYVTRAKSQQSQRSLSCVSRQTVVVQWLPLRHHMSSLPV